MGMAPTIDNVAYVLIMGRAYAYWSRIVHTLKSLLQEGLNCIPFGPQRVHSLVKLSQPCAGVEMATFWSRALHAVPIECCS
jgi:hypothetical protein